MNIRSMYSILESCPPLGLPNGRVHYNKQFPANETERRGIVASFSCYWGYGRIGAEVATCNSAGTMDLLQGSFGLHR